MICGICSEHKDNLVQRLPCSCHFCYDCLLEWIKTDPRENCPGCSIHVQFSALFSNTLYQVPYHEVLLLRHLQKNPLAKPCPALKCGYYAFIENETCSSVLRCPLCNTSWRSNTNQYSVESILTTALEFFQTKKCPNCDSPIEKNGGCPTMKCIKCYSSFCWHCFQNSDGHNQRSCQQNRIIFALTLAIMSLSLINSLKVLPYFLLLAQAVLLVTGYVLASPAIVMLPIAILYCAFSRKLLLMLASVAAETSLVILYYVSEMDFEWMCSIFLLEATIIVTFLFTKQK